eukprot:5925229-Amphidinium_carterae.1
MQALHRTRRPTLEERGYKLTSARAETFTTVAGVGRKVCEAGTCEGKQWNSVGALQEGSSHALVLGTPLPEARIAKMRTLMRARCLPSWGRKGLMDRDSQDGHGLEIQILRCQNVSAMQIAMLLWRGLHLFLVDTLMPLI